MKLLTSMALFASLMFGQQVVYLKAPPVFFPAPMYKHRVEHLPVSEFIAPSTPVRTSFAPALGTLVTLSLHGEALIDQVSFVSDGLPINLTLDPNAQMSAFEVIVTYSYIPVADALGAATK